LPLTLIKGVFVLRPLIYINDCITHDDIKKVKPPRRHIGIPWCSITFC